MTTIKTVNSLSADLDAPTQSLLGLAALAAELATQGVSVKDLFARTGVQPWQLEDPQARISHRQRLTIYRNARALSKRPDIGLLAGARQRISDYGILGYAMVSSSTFGEALTFSLEHIRMAGPVVAQQLKHRGRLRDSPQPWGSIIGRLASFHRGILAKLDDGAFQQSS